MKDPLSGVPQLSLTCKPGHEYNAPAIAVKLQFKKLEMKLRYLQILYVDRI